MNTYLVGKQFGKLRVILRVPKPDHLKNQGRYWLCRCECGKETVVITAALNYGMTRSCGRCIPRGYTPRNLTERFFEKVLITPFHECWEWIGSKRGDGYGQFSIKRRAKKTHQVSWFIHTGKWPTKWVLHKCDNPGCVRPEHLYEGTMQDNINDMVNRKRHYRAVYNTQKTHCPKGHEYNLLNTKFAYGRRHCRMCAKLRIKK